MAKLFQIEGRVGGKDFTAGFCVDGKNLIWETSPILKWMKDRPLYVAESYCKKRGWKLTNLSEEVIAEVNIEMPPYPHFAGEAIIGSPDEKC